MARPSLPELTAAYARTAAFTFGGGDPTMAALQTELVRRRGWMTLDRYVLAYALARVTPGTNMLAFIAGSAWDLLGWRGAAAAVAVTTLPGAILVSFLAASYDGLRAHPRAMAAIGGMLAAAVGLMATGAWQLVSRHFASRDWRMAARAVVFAGAALLLTARFGASPVAVLAGAAALGALWLPPEARR